MQKEFVCIKHIAKGKSRLRAKKQHLKGVFHTQKISPSPALLNCSYLSTSRPPSQHPSVVCVCLRRRRLIPSCCGWVFFPLLEIKYHSLTPIRLKYKKASESNTENSCTRTHARIVLQFRHCWRDDTVCQCSLRVHLNYCAAKQRKA